MYEKHYRGLRYFCSLVGDYESLLILSPNAPSPFCPSMDPETIVSFIKFKRSAEGAELLDKDGNAVKDVLGNPVLCQGGWDDPRNVEQLMSAVGLLHEARGETGRGAFEDRCLACIAAESEGKRDGCRRPHTTSHLWRIGNPLRSEILKNTMKQSTKDGAACVPKGTLAFFDRVLSLTGESIKGDSSFTPANILQLRSYFLGENLLWGFMVFTMILLACKLFMRGDEVMDLMFESIDLYSQWSRPKGW